MIISHGKQILAEYHAEKQIGIASISKDYTGKLAKLSNKQIAILALILLVALVAITGTGDYNQCAIYGVC